MSPPAKCRASRYAFWMVDDVEGFEEVEDVVDEVLAVGLELSVENSGLVDVNADGSRLGETVSSERSGRGGSGGIGSSESTAPVK